MTINYRGNRWYKCDFHLHTPASKCFSNQDVTPKEFIEKVKKEELDCIAITDHNTAEWIDKIKEVAIKEGITIFPGVELTCSDSKIHILVLFDVNCTKQTVEDFILATGIKREDFGKDNTHVTKKLGEIVELADNEGAIVIPAHIDDYNGLWKLDNQIQEEFLAIDSIESVQVVNEDLVLKEPEDIEIEQLYMNIQEFDKKITKEDVKQYIQCVKLIKKMNKGILTFSDNPESENSPKHGLWGIGKKYSYIKMNETSTIESLRQAFLFPKIRIKNCFEDNKEINKLPELWIKRIKINDIETIGDVPLEVEFNPQLTTIIGGRGSGKSTIIRFLTAIFSKDSISKFEQIYADFEAFYRMKNKGGILKTSTEVEIEILKNEKKYIITAKNFRNVSDSDITIERVDEEDGTRKIINDLVVSDLFKADIYNQKQIYSLAKNTNSLRDTIDSLIDAINEHKEKAKQYMSDYKIQYATIKDIEMNISMKKKIELELQDITEKIEMSKKSGINIIMGKYELFNKQRFALKRNIELIQEKEKNLNKFIDEFKVEHIDLDFVQTEYQNELYAIIKKNDNKLKEIITFIENSMEDLKKIKNEYTQDIKDTHWNRDYEIIKKEYTDALENLKDKGIDINDINLLLTNQEKKQKELDDLIKLDSKLIVENKKLDEIKENYLKARDDISELREKYTTQLLLGTNIKIKINKYRDKNDFIRMFRDIIQKDTGFNDSIDKIVNSCFKGNIKENIDSLISDIMKIKYTNDENKDLNGKFKSVIKDLNDEQIASLNLFLPEDDIQVQYKSNGTNRYKLLQNASAGQMTSAILTFILSDGGIPLILDQPEDDLDNHLITDLVVERLKSCKEKRQIIVVTHNANIPVNGDAELTVVMNSDSKKVEIFKSGCIENKEIKDEICGVMEGGENAFIMRANRYSLMCKSKR